MAKRYEVAHGDADWDNLRLGRATSSEFSNIITPKTRKLSSSAVDYADLKIAEILTGQSQGLMQPTKHMERGTLLEVEAGDAYEFTENVTTSRGGFFTTDDGHFGASPDRLVGNNGLLEIKCKLPKGHIKYLVEKRIDPQHMPQIQGQLHITEREWCDWFMYHPDLPRVRIRTYRDEEYIKDLATALDQFRDIMGERLLILEADGHIDLSKGYLVEELMVPDDVLGAG